jgi:hypothetical protein
MLSNPRFVNGSAVAGGGGGGLVFVDDDDDNDWARYKFVFVLVVMFGMDCEVWIEFKFVFDCDGMVDADTVGVTDVEETTWVAHRLALFKLRLFILLLFSFLCELLLLFLFLLSRLRNSTSAIILAR